MGRPTSSINELYDRKMVALPLWVSVALSVIVKALDYKPVKGPSSSAVQDSGTKRVAASISSNDWGDKMQQPGTLDLGFVSRACFSSSFKKRRRRSFI